MKVQYIKSLLWLTKLQWQSSPLTVIWSVFHSLLTGIRPLVQAYALAKLIASVSAVALQGADPRNVYFWLVALLIIEIADQLIINTDRVVSSRARQKMDVVLTEKFLLKMYELSQEQFDDEVFNTKLERARDSLSRMWRVNDEVFTAMSSTISFLGATIAIIAVSPLIGLLIVAVSVPITLIQIQQNKTREKVYEITEPYERVAYRSRWVLINTSSMPEVRLMNAVRGLISSWRSNLTKSYDLQFKNDVQMARSDTVTGLVQPLIGLGANIYFFKLLLAGSIGLDKFIFLRGIIEQANNGAEQLISNMQNLHAIMMSLGIFDEVYATPPSLPNGTVKAKRPLTIEFKNVSFAYPNTTRLILDDISFVITPGCKLALVGENGAGKTTLIKLILRQYLPTKGTITINGTDIADIEQESYYAAISNLSQEFFMLPHLTIRDNLTIGLDMEPHDTQIFRTTDLVDATEIITKLPHKLDTRLDASFDDGTNLSGGQKQRLGVARALLRNGDILILDEPTSAIDAKAEFNIFKNIYEAHAGKTTLIVSHRFSTVRKADKIIVMEQGKIIEYGSHEELIKHGGLYKEMFEVQAEGYK